MDDHTTADDASRYRSDEEVAAWKAKDPLARLKKYMQNELAWTEPEDQEIIDDCTKEIETAVKEYENFPDPDPRDMFKYMYAEAPWHHQEQLRDLEGWINVEDE